MLFSEALVGWLPSGRVAGNGAVAGVQMPVVDVCRMATKRCVVAAVAGGTATNAMAPRSRADDPIILATIDARPMTPPTSCPNGL